MKLIKRKPNKICPCCEKRFFKRYNCSKNQWKDQLYCSVPCKHQKYPIEQYDQKRLEEILFKTITTESGCMEWQGRCSKNGYGQITFLSKIWIASRLVWTLINGEILNELWVLHSCDNRKCINIEHLFLGTHQDNMDDRNNKGRTAKGFSIPNTKLSETDKSQIQQKAKKGLLHKTIAKEFNVHRTVISRIVKNAYP